MRRKLLLLVLLIIVATLAMLALTQTHDPIGGLLYQDDLLSLGRKVVWAVVFGVLAAMLFRGRLTRALQAILFWVALAAVLGVGYAYRYELREIADRVLAELMPGRPATRGHTVEIVRAHGGDFAVSTHVNGAHVPMLLDTGASSVVLTPEAAHAAGLPTGFLSYSVRVDTANGHTQAAPVILDRIAVGGITERAVPALIAQPGQLKTSLLGMSFLNRLESWEVRGTRLVLRGSHASATR